MIGDSNYLIKIEQFDFNSAVGGLAASGNIYNSSTYPFIAYYDDLNPVFKWAKYITDSNFIGDSFDNICFREDGK